MATQTNCYAIPLLLLCRESTNPAADVVPQNFEDNTLTLKGEADSQWFFFRGGDLSEMWSHQITNSLPSLSNSHIFQRSLKTVWIFQHCHFSIKFDLFRWKSKTNICQIFWRREQMRLPEPSDIPMPHKISSQPRSAAKSQQSWVVPVLVLFYWLLMNFSFWCRICDKIYFSSQLPRGSSVNPQKKQILKENLQIQRIKEIQTKIQPNFV